MERTLATCLLQLGYNDKHIRLYRAALELGSAPLTDITKKARLQRSTAYVLAAEMVTAGLLYENHQAYNKQFTAAEPDALLRKLESKYRQLRRSALAFQEALPELRAAHQTTTTRPRVRTFEGRSGLTSVWRDILSEQREMLVWTNQQTEHQVFGQDMHDQFIRERVRRGIPIRVLAVDNAEGRALLNNDRSCNRQTALLPADTLFTSETYIYGDKVAVLDIGTTIFGMITENIHIAASQRALFELTWRQLSVNNEPTYPEARPGSPHQQRPEPADPHPATAGQHLAPDQ